MIQDEIYQQIIQKWIQSLPAKKVLDIIAFFSEYNQLEQVLLRTKNLLKDFYKENPDYYEEIYYEQVPNPVDETFYKMQRIWSSNMSCPSFRATKDAKENIKYMMNTTKFARYKIVIKLMTNYTIDEKDPLFLTWLQALLEVQHIPMEHIIEADVAPFDDDDLADYLKSENKLDEALSETEHNLLFEHPNYDQLFEEAKWNFKLQSLATNYLDNSDYDVFKDLLIANCTRMYFPRLIRKYYQFLNSEGFYEMIDDLIEFEPSDLSKEEMIETVMRKIIETTTQAFANHIYGEPIEIDGDPTNDAIRIINHADQNISLAVLFDICEASMSRVFFQIFDLENTPEEDTDTLIKFGETLDEIFSAVYPFLFHESQKAEPISIAQIFELKN